ncbi:MAG: C40 family peptidase [Lachnospiraceae bacterium]
MRRLTHRQWGCIIALLTSAGLFLLPAANIGTNVPKRQQLEALATPADADPVIIKATPAEAAKQETSSEKEEEGSDLYLKQLNTEITDEIFEALSQRDQQWMNELSLSSRKTPAEAAVDLNMEASDFPEEASWKQIRTTIKDGDGNQRSDYSNVPEILSMVNIYAAYEPEATNAQLLEYAMALWEESHEFQIKISDLYYCSGCQTVENQEEGSFEEQIPEMAQTEVTEPATEEETEEETIPWDVADLEPDIRELSEDERNKITGPGMGEAADLDETEAETASETESRADRSETTLQSRETCPGHADLFITARILGVEEEHGLFQTNAAEQVPLADGRWNGWISENQNYVSELLKQDWESWYGYVVSYPIFQSEVSVQDPLTRRQIDQYLALLPGDLEPERYDMIETALGSVGRIPYYWGGKPSYKGYQENAFGSLVTPDQKGRNLRGLDCSGWIQWVYWTSTGQRLPYESTSGLLQCGTSIERADLQPGDIMVRTGANAHVVLFLGWMADGNMLCIHESSAAVNNVTVAAINADWPYYRSLFP